MHKVETLVISRDHKECFSQRELDALADALSKSVSTRIRIRSVTTEDSEELHVLVEK